MCRLRPSVRALSLAALPLFAQAAASRTPSTTSDAPTIDEVPRTHAAMTIAGACTLVRTSGDTRSVHPASVRGASRRRNASTTSCRTREIARSSGIRRTTSLRASRATVARPCSRKAGSGVMLELVSAGRPAATAACRVARHLQLLPGGGGVKSLQRPAPSDRSEGFFVTRQVSARGSDSGR